MAWDAGTVSIGWATKKSHFDQLLNNAIHILQESATFTGTKTFQSATVFTTNPTFNAGAIGTAEIDNLAVTQAKIANLTVTTGKIAALAVTEAKLGPGAVTGDKIGSLAVTQAKIANATVTTSKIAPLAITVALLGPDAVTKAKIGDEQVGAEHIDWGSGAGEVNVDDVPTSTSKSYLTTGAQNIAGAKTFSAGAVFQNELDTDGINSRTTTSGVTIEADWVGEDATASICVLHHRVIKIGDWNMDATTTITVNVGVNRSKWRGVSIIIIGDDGTYRDAAVGGSSASGDGMGFAALSDSSVMSLVRVTSGKFDNAGFDSTSFNRGWIFLCYVD
jgi:hypothetical protein